MFKLFGRQALIREANSPQDPRSEKINNINSASLSDIIREIQRELFNQDMEVLPKGYILAFRTHCEHSLDNNYELNYLCAEVETPIRVSELSINSLFFDDSKPMSIDKQFLVEIDDQGNICRNGEPFDHQYMLFSPEA